MATEATEAPTRVLVTGATGFIAAHVIQQLQRAGFRVRGTVRDPASSKARSLTDTFPGLELARADLTDDGGWDEAARDCSFIVHMASPFPGRIPRDENDLIRPALDGTRRVLGAAHRAGCVRRVVLTSSVAAMAYDGREGLHVYGEDCWSDPAVAPPYQKSKLLAEREAWRLQGEHGTYELVTICPGEVVGPTLTNIHSTSLDFGVKLLQRGMPGLPHMGIFGVDVRDVAAAHVAALTSPVAAGKRYCLVSETQWFDQLARAVHDEFAPLVCVRARPRVVAVTAAARTQGYEVPTRVLPRWVLWTASWWDREAALLLPELGTFKQFDSSAARRDLGLQLRPLRSAMLDMCYSLVDVGVVPRTARYRSRAEQQAERAAALAALSPTEYDLEPPRVAAADA